MVKEDGSSLKGFLGDGLVGRFFVGMFFLLECFFGCLPQMMFWPL